MEDADMHAMRRSMSGLVGLALLLAGCGERGVDWNAPENLLLREKSTKRDNGVELAYWSLIDAPCQPIYEALVRVTFLVKEGQGMTQAVPIGVLTQGTHDGFLAAAKGVKNRATGK